ncbi:serine hydrolase [Roseivirga sp. E12]|uniref:serine hydrolase domain-containing protein n=1 Tax=Roseivirga sp. E12 TaxID=2819237 RepID=UPI001ABD2C5B|nr:serine hydrolase domain-containing protein [Roseivirga sp. E12]MBO3697806.1 beta-lactamase family protein [Roseivirga sp. E12]
MRKTMLLITCLISLETIGRAQVLSPEIQNQISNILEVDQKTTLPGGALVILRKNLPIYTKYFGLANLNEEIPISKETRFHLNFLTQDFIALATKNLADKGIISLNDLANKYIPELPTIAKDITVNHLIQHTSGLYDYWSLKSLGGWDYDDVFKKEQALQMLSKVSNLNNPPGEAYNFSNTNYLLLAEIIRRSTDNSVNEVLKREFFEPLNMNDAFVSENYAAPVSNKAFYYFDYGEGHQTSFAKYGTDSGPVGLYATLNDLQKWVQFVQKKGESESLVSINKAKHKGHEVSYQDAYYFGYRGFVGEFSDENLTIILLSNDYYYNTHDRALEVASLLLPDRSEEKDQASELESLIGPEEIVGHYWDPVDMHAKQIELRNDTLYYQVPRGWSSPIVLENGKFKLVNSRSNRSIRFYKEEGKAAMTIYTDNTPTNDYTRYERVDHNEESLAEFVGEYYTEIVGSIYKFIVRDGYLTATNLRTEDIILDPLTADQFASEDAWFFSQIQFERNLEGQITGFYLNTPEIKKLWFKKLN